MAVLLLIGAPLQAQRGQAPRLNLRPIAVFDQFLYSGNLTAPRAIAFDRVRNELWVLDSRTGAVGVFEPDGLPLFAFFAAAQLREPLRAAVDPAGQLLVIEGTRAAIRRFSYRGEYRGDLPLKGVGEKPSFGAIAFDESGWLYVGENTSGEILVYDRELNLKRRFGSRGSEEGQFQSIAGLAVDGGEIFVIDHQALAVQVFDSRGNFLRGWGKHDMGEANFSLPEGIAIDSKGRVIVVDALRHEIKFFDREGNFIDRFGGMGKKPGNVMFPSGVTVDQNGHVFVSDRGNGRVQVFETVE